MNMTKDVLISVSGLQAMGGESDNIEVITAGNYYQKNGKHYIVYDEVMEGFDGVIKNTIKVGPDCMDVIKHGIASVHMVFEKDKKRLTSYTTPMGEMMIGLNTTDIQVEERENALKVQVNYSLDINYEHVSECNIIVDVQSKEQAAIHLGG